MLYIIQNSSGTQEIRYTMHRAPENQKRGAIQCTELRRNSRNTLYTAHNCVYAAHSSVVHCPLWAPWLWLLLEVGWGVVASCLVPKIFCTWQHSRCTDVPTRWGSPQLSHGTGYCNLIGAQGSCAMHKLHWSFPLAEWSGNKTKVGSKILPWHCNCTISNE